jgi:hypothetical protein
MVDRAYLRVISNLEPRAIICRRCKQPGGTLVRVGDAYEHDKCLQYPGFTRKMRRAMR